MKWIFNAKNLSYNSVIQILSSAVIFPRIGMVLNVFLKKSKYLQTSREKNQWQTLEEAKQYGICQEHI